MMTEEEKNMITEDDRNIMPEWIKNMTLEEIQHEIEKIEREMSSRPKQPCEKKKTIEGINFCI